MSSTSLLAEEADNIAIISQLDKIVNRIKINTIPEYKEMMRYAQNQSECVLKRFEDEGSKIIAKAHKVAQAAVQTAQRG